MGKKKSNKPLFVSFLLDETGSMQSIKDDTIGGFNAYLKELQQGDGETLFSLVSFNSSRTAKRYVAEPIKAVKPLTEEDYRPNAMTPLIDAAVKIIKATDEAVESRTGDADVVVVMQTDGQENVSVEYTSADLALLVKEKEAAGWQFVFLGAGMDAFEAARDAGLDLAAERVMSYGRDRSEKAFEVMAGKMRYYQQFRSSSALDFTDEEREDVGDVFGPGRMDPGTARKKEREGRSKDRGRSSVDDFSL